VLDSCKRHHSCCCERCRCVQSWRAACNLYFVLVVSVKKMCDSWSMALRMTPQSLHTPPLPVTCANATDCPLACRLNVGLAQFGRCQHHIAVVCDSAAFCRIAAFQVLCRVHQLAATYFPLAAGPPSCLCCCCRRRRRSFLNVCMRHGCCRHRFRVQRGRHSLVVAALVCTTGASSPLHEQRRCRLSTTSTAMLG
jgi:hypothetical protein